MSSRDFAPARGDATLLALASLLRGALPAREPDWVSLIALANQTLTTPALAEALCALRPVMDVREDVCCFLAEVQERNRRRNRRLLEQLQEAAGCLNRIGVRPLLLKGAAWLTLVAPEKAGGRMVSDLDLMVPAAVFGQAADQLRQLGYALEAPLGEPLRSAVLQRPGDAATIDLHCCMRGVGLSCDAEDVQVSATPLSLGGAEVLRPSSTWQLMMLVLHDQLRDEDYVRGLIDLRHLVDTQILARAPEGVAWEQLEAMFPSRLARHALRVQLYTASRLLDVPVPQRLTAGLWPRLQFWRRLLQARWPSQAAVLTLLTMLIAPAYIAARITGEAARSQLQTGSKWLELAPRARRYLQRILRTRAIGKA